MPALFRKDYFLFFAVGFAVASAGLVATLPGLGL